MNIGNATIGGAALGAAGSVAASALNMFNAKQQRQWEEQMMERQHGWDLDQWNREVAYNDPAAQRARLEAAGYNALDTSKLTDAGSASGQNTASHGPVSLPHVDNPFANGLGLAQSELNKAQVELIHSQANKNDAEADLAKSNTQTIEESRSLILEKLGVDIQVAQSIEEVNKAKLPEIAENIKLASKQIEKLDNDIEVALGKLSLDRQELALKRFIQNAQLELQKEGLSIEDKKAQASLINAYAAKRNAAAAERNAQTAEKAEQRAQDKHEYEVLKVSNDGKISVERLKQEEYRTFVAETEAKYTDYEHYVAMLQKFADIEAKAWRNGPLGIPIPVDGAFTRQDSPRMQARKSYSNLPSSIINK